jgi:hypothetical protein
MPDDNDEQDEKSADQDVFVCIETGRLAWLFMITAERIEYEEHGAFVTVGIDDLRWLENIENELEKEFARYDDDTN